MDEGMIDSTIQSIGDLVQKANEFWQEQTEKRKEHEEKLKGVLETALAEETGLIKELTAAKKTVAGLESEYFELEKSVEKEEKKRVGKEQLTAEKVKSGEITLRAYQARGVTAEQKTSLIISGILEKLKASLNVIRSKKKEILQQELELAKLKNKVFRLNLYPGQVLSKAYQNQIEYLNTNMSVLHADVVQSDSSAKQLEHQLHLSEGKGLSAGHRWNRLTLEQAQRILFDPIIPEALIKDLKQQLQEFQGTEELINIILHMAPGKDPSLEVNPAAGIRKGGMIQTGKKVKKVKKNKAINTRD